MNTVYREDAKDAKFTSFLFSAFPALWNAKPIPLGSAEKIYLSSANFAS
jgi:hypothetical protein